MNKPLVLGDYRFNALGHRVTKTVSGQTLYFAYNENNQLIGEYDDTGTVINEYVYFGLRPVAVKTALQCIQYYLVQGIQVSSSICPR